MSRIVIVYGLPAAGKRTYARSIAADTGAVALDKDVLGAAMINSAMDSLTGVPHDRDSDLYRSLFGSPVYEDLLTIAQTMAEAGVPVVCHGPFLEHAHAAKDEGISLSAHLRERYSIPEAIHVVTVAVDVTEDMNRRRMQARGADRDEVKLSTWESYARRVVVPGRAAILATADHIIG